MMNLISLVGYSNLTLSLFFDGRIPLGLKKMGPRCGG